MEENTRDIINLVCLLLGILTVVFWLWRRLNLGRDTSVTTKRIKEHQGNHKEEVSYEGGVHWRRKNPGHKKIRVRSTGHDSLAAARRIREHQGNHEVEVSCGGEADLHRFYKRCQKNPGHTQFIPVKDFKIEHLPSGHQENLILDWIRAEADLTCRLFSKYTSELRPRCEPFYNGRDGHCLRTGTGWVKDVNRYTEKDKKTCDCEECTKSTQTSKKVWGEVEIYTACHVVYNTEEARYTTCYFSYDKSRSRLPKCPKLPGLSVEYSDIKGDMCIMRCVTHDMDLVDKLVKMCDHRLNLFEKVRSKYWLDESKGWRDPGVSCVTDPTPGHVVIISHPHGCSKQVSVGKWTDRQTRERTEKYEDSAGVKAEYVSSSYSYNAATCPGSSGAPVIRLLEKGRVGWWWLLYSHPHSRGHQGRNDNYSGKIEEFVSFPPTSSDKFPKFILVVFVLGSSIGMAITTYMTGDWGIDNLIVDACVVMTPVLCYCFIPFCRQEISLQWALVIFMSLLSLFSLVFFAMTLVVYDNFILKVIYGACFVIVLAGTVYMYRRTKADPLTSYKIQHRLRRRTRVTTTTATTAITESPPTTATTTTTTTISKSLELPPQQQQKQKRYHLRRRHHHQQPQQ